MASVDSFTVGGAVSSVLAMFGNARAAAGVPYPWGYENRH